MSTLKISGHSDDIVCYELEKESDELYPPETEKAPYVGTLLVHARRGRALVHVLYDGCWSFAVCKVDEDDPELWPFKSVWSGYSQHLEITVPTGAKVEWRK